MNDDLFDSANILDGGVELFGFENGGEPENPGGHDPENPEDGKQPPIEEPAFTDDDLFGDDPKDPENPEEEEEEPENGEQEPESVGGKKKNKAGKEGADPNGGDGSSPNGKTFSSLAKALYGDGLFQSLDEETVNDIKDADSFYEAIEQEINGRLDEKTRRINDALEAGVQVNVIKQYENTLTQLNGITDEALSAETEEGKKLRSTILYQDYINRGFAKERASREVKRIFDSGSDIDDAREALESVKEFFEDKYDALVEEGQAKVKADKEKTKAETAQFKKAVLETEKVFGEIEVDKATRRKAYDLMTKIVKTTDDGEQLTAVQLYADEHPVEFRTMLGIVAALTDGFTKPGNLLKQTVDKKVRRNLTQFERNLAGGNPHRGGTINFVEGEEENPDNPPRRRFRLDID